MEATVIFATILEVIVTSPEASVNTTTKGLGDEATVKVKFVP